MKVVRSCPVLDIYCRPDSIDFWMDWIYDLWVDWTQRGVYDVTKVLAREKEGWGYHVLKLEEAGRED